MSDPPASPGIAEHDDAHLDLLYPDASSDRMEVDEALAIDEKEEDLKEGDHEEEYSEEEDLGEEGLEEGASFEVVEVFPDASGSNRSHSRVPSEPRADEDQRSVRSRASSARRSVVPILDPMRPPPMEASYSPVPLQEEEHEDTELSRDSMRVEEEHMEHMLETTLEEEHSRREEPSRRPTSEDIFMDLIHTSSYNEPPLPTAWTESQQSVSEYVLDATPPPDPPQPDFTFTEEILPPPPAEPPKPTVAPLDLLYTAPVYTLPSFSALPAEYIRKGRPKQSRKREKEKGDGKAQEWTPLGLNKWGAVIRANPVHTKLSKATKCVNTRDWMVRSTDGMMFSGQR